MAETVENEDTEEVTGLVLFQDEYFLFYFQASGCLSLNGPFSGDCQAIMPRAA
jgi:hypothetical protein